MHNGSVISDGARSGPAISAAIISSVYVLAERYGLEFTLARFGSTIAADILITPYSNYELI